MLPGGYVEAGENPAEAALREVIEETGLHARLPPGPEFDEPDGANEPSMIAPLWIIEQHVPAERREPEAHVHLDHLYLALAEVSAPALASALRTSSTKHAYLRQLDRQVTAILAHGVPTTYHASLAASLHLAFERLAADHPAALVLLRLAAQLAPEPIPLTLFTARADRLPPPLKMAAGDPVAFAAITRLLRHRALARVSPDSLQVHRLVQAVLRDSPTSTPDDDMAIVARRLLRDAVPADPWNNPASWPVWRQLLSHVLAVTDPACGVDPDHNDVPWLLDRAATYLVTQGEYGPARALFARAYQLNRDILGEDHPHTLNSASNLANDLRELGEHQQARQLDEDTLSRYRRALGEDHPHTLNSAHNLAHVLRVLGEHEQVLELEEWIKSQYQN
jgi:ADP-ribose pyrophosphatase YjhB (NUDIX family)